MTNKYDIIIIGSGLNALATLHGILQRKRNYKIAIIAGKPKFNVNKNHPVIFKDLQRNKKIYSHKVQSNNFSLPGNIGGLVYFWGEQCNVNEKKRYKDKNFQKIKNFFLSFLNLKNGKKLFKMNKKDFKFIFETTDQTIKNIESMKKFKKYFKKNSIMFYNEALSIDKNLVYLDNENIIYGKKIFICAGLIGTINLLKSMKQKIDFTFKDHSSSVDLIYSKKIKQESYLKSIYSMVCKIYSKRNEINLYAKFYPIKSLEVLFFLGKLKFFLPKFILNYKINFRKLYFVQKWSNYSISEYNSRGILIKKFKTINEFNKLDSVYKNLEFKRLLTFKPNLLNYHFHDLNVIENKKKIPVNIFLKKNNPKVFCPGLLSEKKIDCLPPNFNSFIKTSSLLQRLK